MRADMSKVVTEKPRRGSSARSLKTGRRLHWSEFDSDDHGSTHHKISRHGQYGWNAKEFTDVLTPLQRYLRKQVGRPWNDVYSELAQTLDKRSLTGLHIWTHIVQEVVFHTEWQDGHVWCSPRYGSHYRVDDNNHMPGYSLLYVHPLTGLLCEEPAGAWRDRRPAKGWVEVDELTNFERVNGCWFEVKYAKGERYVPAVKHGNYVIRQGYFTDEKLKVSQRQLSRKELKRHGLHNVNTAARGRDVSMARPSAPARAVWRTLSGVGHRAANE